MAATMNMPTYQPIMPSHHATGLGLRQTGHAQPPTDVIEQLRQRVETRYSSLRDAFMRIDRDNNGSLSRDEVLAALAEFNIPPRHLNSLLAAIDTNGDGVLSFSEFSARPCALGWGRSRIVSPTALSRIGTSSFRTLPTVRPG